MNPRQEQDNPQDVFNTTSASANHSFIFDKASDHRIEPHGTTDMTPPKVPEDPPPIYHKKDSTSKNHPTIQITEIPSPQTYQTIRTECLDEFNTIDSYSSRICPLPKEPSTTIKLVSFIPLQDSLGSWHRIIYIHAFSDTFLIGKMIGQYIDRDQIRYDPTKNQELFSVLKQTCCWTIFDDYANLRPEYSPGGSNSGTGKWGKEVNSGALFVVTWVFVSRDWRGKGLGELMFRCLLRKAFAVADGYRWAVVEPGVIVESPGIGCKREGEGEDDMLDVARRFYRKFGFRRVGTTGVFARATDRNHSTRRVDFTEEMDLDGDELLLSESLDVDGRGVAGVAVDSA